MQLKYMYMYTLSLPRSCLSLCLCLSILSLRFPSIFLSFPEQERQSSVLTGCKDIKDCIDVNVDIVVGMQ